MINNMLLSLGLFVLSFDFCCAQSFSIKNDRQLHTVTFSNRTIKFVLNYDHECRVSNMEVNGQKVIDSSTGIYSEIKTADKTFSTLKLTNQPFVTVTGNSVNISGINHGGDEIEIRESWKFLVSDTGVQFTIVRNCSKAFRAESVSFPAIEFNDINTWEGAFQGFGGIAWFYLFNEKLFGH